MCRRPVPIALFGAFILLSPTSARADVFALGGAMLVGSARPSLGVGWSYSPSLLGVEVEYLGTLGGKTLDRSEAGGVFASVLVQSSSTSDLQLFVIGGIGVWGETFDDGGTGALTAKNLGGGVKVAIAPRLKLRLDYRLFVVDHSEDGSRDPSARYPQRFAAGLQVVF